MPQRAPVRSTVLLAIMPNTELSELQRRLHDAHESASRLRDTITRLEAEKVMLAKLAAETPQFYNPWHCAEAIKLRDAVLANVQTHA